MKKGHIRILILVMSASLLSLLAVQWFWVRNAVALREKQFQFKVMGAMESVTQRLEDRETAIALSGATALGLPALHLENHPTNAHPMGFDLRTGDCKPLPMVVDSLPHRIERTQHSRRHLVDGKWITDASVETKVVVGDTEMIYHERKCQPSDQEYFDYMQDVMDRMVCGVRPIHERLRFSLLDTLIRQELLRRNIDEAFLFDILTDGGKSLRKEKDPVAQAVDHEGEYFRALLFPHDLTSSEYYLELQFPERTSTTMRAMGVVLPTSGILIMIVMACFGIALIAFRRQQKLSDLKTDFINNMTHELKTPISTISLALEALGDPDMQTKERIGLYTRVIGQENDRLKIQVERVLQAAALERGELKLDMQPLDIDAVLQDQIERIRLHVEGRGGKITYFPEATNTLVTAEEVHLGGVLFNLLDNANKYSPTTPQILVHTRNTNGGIEVSVSDKGLGISQESQRRVFEKFYRVPTGNVHDVKGFGIGLSYARSMARAHGGDIKLTSEPGIGSTFTLFIPQNQSHT